MPLINDPIDLSIDSVTDDLIIPPVFTTGVDAVKQQIERALAMFKGEWFLDLDAGTAWYQNILGHKFNEIDVHEAFRESLEGVPGVAEIVSMNITYNNSTRILDVDWKVRCEFNDTGDDVETNAVIAGFFTTSA